MSVTQKQGIIDHEFFYDIGIWNLDNIQERFIHILVKLHL